MKHRMTRECEAGDYEDKVGKVCCHEKGAPEKEKKKCHIPWAQLEHLKQPASWKSRHLDDIPPPHMWQVNVQHGCPTTDKLVDITRTPPHPLPRTCTCTCPLANVLLPRTRTCTCPLANVLF